MGEARIDLSTQTFEDIVIVFPVGRIDHNSAEAFQTALLAHVESIAGSGSAKMVLDLSGVDYMSSVGLRALMVAAKQSKKDNTTIVVAAMQPIMKEIFEISRFDFVFKTFNTVADALSEVSPAAAEAHNTTG